MRRFGLNGDHISVGPRGLLRAFRLPDSRTEPVWKTSNHFEAQEHDCFEFADGILSIPLFVRNNRRANEVVQFRKFFVHIGVAAVE
jgi:hypothetical protein